MAYKITHYSYPGVAGAKPVITAVLDSADDLVALGHDYHPGSVAFVADTDIPAYMMNASGEWKSV